MGRAGRARSHTQRIDRERQDSRALVTLARARPRPIPGGRQFLHGVLVGDIQPHAGIRGLGEDGPHERRRVRDLCSAFGRLAESRGFVLDTGDWRKRGPALIALDGEAAHSPPREIH